MQEMGKTRLKQEEGRSWDEDSTEKVELKYLSIWKILLDSFDSLRALVVVEGQPTVDI